MIELNTGAISFPNLSLTLSPMSTRESFLSSFPQGRFHKLRDTASGCSWYGAKEKIYADDTEVPIWLCFNSDDRLSSVELYPQFACEMSPEGFPLDAEETEQKYCAAWLQKYCSLTWSDTGFPWGTICNDYDARSDSCGIVIRYSKQDEKAGICRLFS